MRLIWRCAFALLVLAAGSLPLRSADGFVPNRLIVGHRAGSDASAAARIFAMHGAVARRQIPELRMSVLEVLADAREATLASLERLGIFEYVERDYYAHTGGVPNDPSYGSEWHLSRIQGPQAWNVTTGSAAVVVAVIDSGVYGGHPDLAGKLVPGWNFVKSTADTSDNLGHGTAVAGTIAAASNNGIGVAAVNWGSLVMPLVVVDDSDFASYSDIASAILYAADHGVRVMNISIGGTGYSAALQSAVDYAWNRGALIFASAMNDHVSTANYPAACNHVVAVTATDSTDQLASFSNYGTWVTMSAPGTSILTTTNTGGYAYWSGTSFSSPIVAGVAALALAMNPALTNATVVQLLQQTADDLGPAGFDPSFGWGRVNAYRMVMAAKPVVTAPTAPVPVQSPRRPGRINRTLPPIVHR